MPEFSLAKPNDQIDPSSNKKVFVTGCFDLLHSGHIAFLKEAASYGNLYVSIGSDQNVYQLKGRYPVNEQDERKYMIEALACVHKTLVNSGWGYVDFEKELSEVNPDIFIVNEDGHSPAKKALCKEKGNAILKKDIQDFGHNFKRSFEAQIEMFPNMVNDELLEIIGYYKEKELG